MQHTYKYLISLLFIVCVLSVQAQQNKQDKQDTTNVKPAFFDHFRVDLDLVPLINTVFSNGETYSYEAGVQASIKNKYFPAVEIGFAGTSGMAAIVCFFLDFFCADTSW